MKALFVSQEGQDSVEDGFEDHSTQSSLANEAKEHECQSSLLHTRCLRDLSKNHLSYHKQKSIGHGSKEVLGNNDKL